MRSLHPLPMSLSTLLTDQHKRGSAVLLFAGLTFISVGAVLLSARTSRASQDQSAKTTKVEVLQQTFVAVPAVAAATPTPKAPEVVTIAKSDDRESVRAGEILTYRIRIRNANNEDRNEVKIVDHVPPFLVPLTFSPAAEVDPKRRTITWRNQTISALAEVTFAFTARVHPSTPDGTILENRVVMNGPGVRGSALDRTVVVAPKVAAAPAPPPARKPTTPPAPVTVSAPRPVPTGVGTGMDASTVFLTLGGLLTGTGGYFLRHRKR